MGSGLLRIGLSSAPFDSDTVRGEALAQLESRYNFGRSARHCRRRRRHQTFHAEDARLASATTALCGEVCALYHDAMNTVIFNSDSLNPYHLQAYLTRGLPLPPPFQGPPELGVAANPRDEGAVQQSFSLEKKPSSNAPLGRFSNALATR